MYLDDILRDPHHHLKNSIKVKKKFIDFCLNKLLTGGVRPKRFQLRL